MKDLSAKLYAPDQVVHSGTAWLISDTYALTAFHCVTNPHNGDQPYPKTTRFRLEFDSGNQMEAIVDQYDANIDAALLHILARTTAVSTKGKLFFGKLPIDTWNQYQTIRRADWTSYGYPVSHPPGLTIGGLIRSPQAPVDGLVTGTENAIQLTCDEGGHAHLNGMSGAAVSHNDSIIGIIKSGPPDLQQTVIHAVSLERIAEVLPMVRRIIEENYDTAIATFAPNILRPTQDRPRQQAGSRRQDDGPACAIDAPSIRLRISWTRKPPELYGRDSDIVSIQELIDHHGVRLLTLTGEHGIGKTRLALEVGDTLITSYDGVSYVDLGPVNDPASAPSEIANALGVKEAHDNLLLESLVTDIGDSKVLLVIDGCEQLAGLKEFTEQLLRECANLRIIAIGAATLGWQAEQEYRVKPLDVPTDRDLSAPLHATAGLGHIKNLPVVRFFADRLRDANGQFALTVENIRSVGRICSRIGGVPLAISITAAYLGAKFTGDELHDNDQLSTFDRELKALGNITLEDKLRHLVTWTCDALDVETRSLLWRLSVFNGICTLDAAQAIDQGIGTSRRPTVDKMNLLVDRNLLSVCKITREKHYYRMPAYLQRFCKERLQAAGESTFTALAHAAYYAHLVEKAERRLTSLSSAEAQEWIELLELEYDNIRGAIGWIHRNPDIRDNIDLGVRIVGNLFWFWNLRGSLAEGLQWSGKLLTHPAQHTESFGSMLYCAGGLAFLQGDFLTARKWLTQSVVILEQVGSHRRLGFALSILGMVALHQNHLDEARWYEQRSVDLFEKCDVRSGLALALNDLGNVLLESNDLEAAEFCYDRSHALWKVLGINWGIGLTASNLGHLACRRHDYDKASGWLIEAMQIQQQGHYQWGYAETIKRMAYLRLAKGDYEHAIGLFYDSLVLHQKIGRKQLVSGCMDGLAEIAIQLKEPVYAAHLFGAAMKIREDNDMDLPHAQNALHDQLLAAARLVARDAHLNETLFDAAVDEGKAMSYPDAVKKAYEYAQDMIMNH